MWNPNSNPNPNPNCSSSRSRYPPPGAHTELDSVRHPECFAGGILPLILLLPKEKKSDGVTLVSPSEQSPLGGSAKKKKHTGEKWCIFANYDGNEELLASSTYRGIMEFRTRWRIGAAGTMPS